MVSAGQVQAVLAILAGVLNSGKTGSAELRDRHRLDRDRRPGFDLTPQGYSNSTNW
jgi:hypothetical protein